MTKAELIDRIIRSQKLSPDMTKKAVGEILDVAFQELGGYFVQGKIQPKHSVRFTYPGFGTFTKKRRPSRKGVHPRTLEAIRIEGFDTLDFRPSAELRRAMNPDRQEGSRAAAGIAGPSGRRLLSRDDAELDAGDLPPARLRSTSAGARKPKRRVNQG